MQGLQRSQRVWFRKFGRNEAPQGKGIRLPLPPIFLGDGLNHFLLLMPLPGEMIQFDYTHIFKMGW